ncbi:hypothetical protein L1887_16652 [Cichorium endivia]|nr:hypothetical protein L1887_16652 [Cichorium endivia]
MYESRHIPFCGYTGGLAPKLMTNWQKLASSPIPSSRRRLKSPHRFHKRVSHTLYLFKRRHPISPIVFHIDEKTQKSESPGLI